MQIFLKKITPMLGAVILFMSICHIATLSSYAGDCINGGEHEYTVIIIKKATEEEQGLRQYTCKICGYSYTEEIPSLGHTWGDWIVDIEPTATKPGHRYRVCTKYPDTPHYEEETIPELGIEETSPTSTTAVAPTEPSQTTEPETHSTLAESLQTSAASSVAETTIFITNTETGTEETSEAESEPAAIQVTISDNTPKSGGGLLSGPVNAVDAVFTAATAGIVWWYVVFLWPFAVLLIWAKKKRRDVRKRMNQEGRL